MLNNRFNDAYSPLLSMIVPFTLFMAEVIFGVGAIKLYHVLPSVVFVTFPIVKSSTFFMGYVAMKIAAKCHGESSLLLSYWKGIIEDDNNALNSVRMKYIRAFGSSSQAIKVVVGNLTYISRNGQCIYMDLVMNSTISVMLAMELE